MEDKLIGTIGAVLVTILGVVLISNPREFMKRWVEVQGLKPNITSTTINTTRAAGIGMLALGIIIVLTKLL